MRLYRLFNKKPSITNQILIASIIFITGIRLYFCKVPNLDVDEANWWVLAQHLSFGYYKHPPLCAWLIRLFTSLGKDTEFFIRLGFIIFFIFSTVIIYLLGKEISGSKRAGLYSALLLNIIPLFSIEAMIAVPESLQMFFYLIILYLFTKAIKKNGIILWIATGIFLGLGLLTVYSVALLIPVLFIFLCTSSEHRILLRRKGPYLALFIALFIISPNIVWNMLHNGGGLTSGYIRIFPESGLTISFKGLLLFLRSQFIAISFIFSVVFLFIIPYGGYVAIRRKDSNLWLLFLCSAILSGLLFLRSLLEANGIDFDWSTIALLPAVILTAVLFNEMYQKFIKYRFILLSLLIISSVFTFTFTILGAINLIRPYSFIYNSFNGTFNNFYGWHELSKRIIDIKNLQFKNEKVFTFSDNRHIACELSFYSGGKPTYFIDLNLRHHDKDFGLWEQFPADTNAIFISECPMKQKTLSYIKRFFNTIKADEPFVVYKQGSRVKMFYIYKCYI